MQPKFTLKGSGIFLGTPVLLFLFCLFAGITQAQTYDNANISTGTTTASGATAPAGKQWSECQNPTGNTNVANTNGGYGAQIASNNALADDFTVTGTWAISKITVYAYSTGYAGSTSPFNDLRIRIHNGNPMLGPTTVVFGDLTTNRLTASPNTNLLRIFNTVVAPASPPNSDRQVWALEADVAVSLPAGTYWLEFQTGTALASNFVVPATPVGVRTLPGYNAIQRIGATWAAIEDIGQGPAATPVPMDIAFKINYSTSACSGAPAPGNTISSANPVCPSVNFTLSAQNATPGSGVSYQWESSPNGTTWTPISGATNSTYTTNQTTATYYRVVVTCSGNSTPTTGLQVNMAPISACYCIPTYGNGCALGDYISRVRLGTLDNASLCSTPPYTYYSALPAPEVFRGASNQLIVNVGPDTFGQNVGAWIDFNQDGDFNDPGEFLGTSGNVGANGQATMTFSAPAGATLGVTRMRIRGGDDTAPTAGQSCGASNSSFGEAEDYNVNIVPCVPITITGQPANATTQCSNNASFSVTAAGSLPSYSWQFRVNASSPWQTVTSGGVFGSNVNAATLNLTAVPSTMNGYQFRALVTGACSAVDFSNFATLTVSPLVATVSPTSATICAGQSTSISLTNVASPVTVLSEGFNVVDPLPTGWASQNNSAPIGVLGWFQGNTTVFPAQSGPADSYIAANFNNTAGTGTISNWLMTPMLTIKNGDVLKFWSRTVTTADFPDRLEVRLSTAGASVNVGATSTSVGDFTNLLLTINPNLLPNVYPDVWTEYTITVSGLPATTTGRFAFRYFVTNAGPTGANSDYFGIDNVTYTAGGSAAGIWTANPATPNSMFTDAGLTTAYTGTPVQTIYVNPNVTTVYSVVYSTSVPACTSNPTNVTVNVVQPVSNVVAPTNKTVCVGGSTSFTASASGGPLSFVWEVSTNGGATWTTIAGATSGTLNVNNVTQVMNNNMYRARINAAPCAGGPVTTSPATLTVTPLPTVTASASSLAITPGQTTTLSVTSSPLPGSPANYQWFYNGNAVAGGTNSTLTVGIDDLGEYSVRLTDVNGCTNTSNTVTIGAQQSDRLWIYPNPTDGQFLVRLYYDGPYTDIRWIHIFNEKGQLVMKKAFDLYPTQPPYMQMSFDMTKFPAGTYVVKVEEKYSSKIKSGLLVIQ